jgi:hypothetical protein
MANGKKMGKKAAPKKPATITDKFNAAYEKMAKKNGPC